MSESTTKKLRAEVARLRERIDIHRDKEIKLLDEAIEAKARLGEALQEIQRLRDALRQRDCAQ